MATSRKQYLFHTKTMRKAFEVSQEGLDVLFPPGIGWTEVLDCRIAPYDGQTIEENCDYAGHVRKRYILVTESQVEKATPTTTPE